MRKRIGPYTPRELERIIRAYNDFCIAREHFEVALTTFEKGKKEEDDLKREVYVREAFDQLFHCARIASIAYLQTKKTGWKTILRMLPSPHREEFEEMADMLHVKYFYQGKYPKDKVEEEFNKWTMKVKEYAKKLSIESPARAIASICIMKCDERGRYHINVNRHPEFCIRCNEFREKSLMYSLYASSVVR